MAESFLLDGARSAVTVDVGCFPKPQVVTRAWRAVLRPGARMTAWPQRGPTKGLSLRVQPRVRREGIRHDTRDQLSEIELVVLVPGHRRLVCRAGL